MIIISSVSANIVKNKVNNVIAYANVVFDDKFIVRGIRVVEKTDGKRLMLMPSRQSKAGAFKDMCHPLTPDFRRALENMVMTKVNELLNIENIVEEA